MPHGNELRMMATLMCCMFRERLQKMRLRTSTGLAHTSSHQHGSSSESGGGGGGTMCPMPGCKGCTKPHIAECLDQKLCQLEPTDTLYCPCLAAEVA